MTYFLFVAQVINDSGVDKSIGKKRAGIQNAQRNQRADASNCLVDTSSNAYKQQAEPPELMMTFMGCSACEMAVITWIELTMEERLSASRPIVHIMWLSSAEVLLLKN